MNKILEPGFKFQWKYKITERMLVPNLYFDSAYCQKMPPVLATGFLVGILEMACIHSISELLNVGEQTVGSFVQFKHLAPSLAGMDVVVNGELLARDQRRLYFKLNANDGVDLIAEGEHERYIIEPKRFTEKALTKLQRTL